MKSPLVLGLGAMLLLSACGRATEGVSGSAHHGRYAGVGLYPAGRMWAQLVRANPPKDPALATLRDDDEIIVVVDSATGEVRQCGNLSGYCLAMSPWAKAGAPGSLVKHAVQLDQEAETQGAAPPVQGRSNPKPR